MAVRLGLTLPPAHSGWHNTRMRWRVVVLSWVASAMLGCTFVSDIAPEDARRLVQSGARLIDVRSPEEYAEGHIEGAVNIPVGDLSLHLGELGGKDTPIVVYCHTGIRASRAEHLLQDAGFTDVHNLGGIGRWQ